MKLLSTRQIATVVGLAKSTIKKWALKDPKCPAFQNIDGFYAWKADQKTLEYFSRIKSNNKGKNKVD